MVIIKKILFIIIFILFVFVAYISYRNTAGTFNKEFNLAKEDLSLIIEEPMKYNIEINNIGFTLKYIDPSEKDRYRDLLILYSLYLPKTISSEPDTFYDLNSETIENILGVYSLEMFLNFNEKIKTVITSKSKIKNIEIIEIFKEGNLLKGKVRFSYDTGDVVLEHDINYVYIKALPNLFIYTTL